MKFELTPNEEGYYLLTISRTEFLKHFNADRELCLELINGIIEMFCAPWCFETSISATALENIAGNFTTSRKKFGFTINDGKLEMMYLS